MTNRKKHLLWLGLLILSAVILTVLIAGSWHHAQTAKRAQTRHLSGKKTVSVKPAPVKVDWQAPSEKSAYPSFSENPGAWVQVSLKAQRVYIRDAQGRILYRMLCSSGQDNTTPTGNFNIQAERGQSFYNPSLKEGANFWVSFKDHGVYLFHSVPTQADGHYNITEAEKLGHPASHGCIRLTVSDAKWFYENVPDNTKVVIGD